MNQSSIDAASPVEASRSARLRRIRQVSKAMVVACAVVAPLLVAGLLIYWIATPANVVFHHAGLSAEPSASLALWMRLAAFALSMVPLGVLIHGLLCARRAFKRFASGETFSPDAVRGLRSFAVSVAVSSLLKPIAGAALSVLLSATRPDQPRSLVLSVGSDTLLALLFAGTVAVIAWILVEATDIADEYRQFV